MITLLTGAPGSGKTLYTISKLLPPLIGSKVNKIDDDGTTQHIERIIYSNIRGLLVDHEVIDESRLNTWHEWAPVGAIIVFDEVQKPWPPRANGSKVPEPIQNLETHRHMGVDFIFMTQHPLLVDRNLIQLVGRHLHVRRVANMNLAVVYEWDHCSRSLLFKNSITKGPWRYDKSVFKLYKSAEAHTKQPRKVPGLVWFILAGLLSLGYFVPTVKERIFDKVSGKSPAHVAQSSIPSDAVPLILPAASAPVASVPEIASFPVSPASSPVPQDAEQQANFSGCVRVATSCTCFDTKGTRVDVEPKLCSSMTGADRPPALSFPTAFMSSMEVGHPAYYIKSD